MVFPLVTKLIHQTKRRTFMSSLIVQSNQSNSPSLQSNLGPCIQGPSTLIKSTEELPFISVSSQKPIRQAEGIFNSFK